MRATCVAVRVGFSRFSEVTTDTIRTSFVWVGHRWQPKPRNTYAHSRESQQRKEILWESETATDDGVRKKEKETSTRTSPKRGARLSGRTLVWLVLGA
jgi:hypothetical protein